MASVRLTIVHKKKANAQVDQTANADQATCRLNGELAMVTRATIASMGGTGKTVTWDRTATAACALKVRHGQNPENA